MQRAEDGVQAGVTAQAEALLNRAFTQLRESVDGDLDTGLGALFPHGLEDVEIRVDVRLSETESASVDLRVKGRDLPDTPEIDYDEFDDPMLYEDDDEL